MSEPEFRFHVAKKDVGFMHGFSVGEHDAVKVHPGEAYIEHVNSAHVITIINPDDRWYHSKLFVVNVSPHLGYHDGVYADDEQEAWDIFADYCNEDVPDPENPGHIKKRYPGFVSSWSEAMDDCNQDEQAVDDFTTGPYGNEGVLFRDGGNGIYIQEVHDPKVPPISDLFYSRFFPLDEILDIDYSSLADDDTVRSILTYQAYQDCKTHFEHKFTDESWVVRLVDLIEEARKNEAENTLKIHSSIHAVVNPDRGGVNVYIISLLSAAEEN